MKIEILQYLMAKILKNLYSEKRRGLEKNADPGGSYVDRCYI